MELYTLSNPRARQSHAAQHLGYDLKFSPFVEYKMYWRVISRDRRIFLPSDVLFSKLNISFTTRDTKKLLIFSENLGIQASFSFGFMQLSPFVFE